MFPAPLPPRDSSPSQQPQRKSHALCASRDCAEHEREHGEEGEDEDAEADGPARPERVPAARPVVRQSGIARAVVWGARARLQDLVRCSSGLRSVLRTSVVMCSFSADRAKGLTGQCKDHYIYNTVIRAIIESSLIAWVGLVTCAVASTYNLAHSGPSYGGNESDTAFIVSYQFK
jgi:hypothetical protein